MLITNIITNYFSSSNTIIGQATVLEVTTHFNLCIKKSTNYTLDVKKESDFNIIKNHVININYNINIKHNFNIKVI